jgi:predicted nucleic-acid-binding Zn-ribbon protein
MDKHRQHEIIEALNSKEATQPCPRCRNLEFEIVGETRIQLADTENTLLGFAELPVILIACKRCGYIAQHSKGVLGLAR